jgi:hypothetical protein
MQYASRVSNAAGVQGHIDNLLLHLSTVTGISILEQEGATRTGLRAAAVALLALTGLPIADNIGALTVGTVQYCKDHCASPSYGCFSASHHGSDHSTSTPLRHLRRELCLVAALTLAHRTCQRYCATGGFRCQQEHGGNEGSTWRCPSMHDHGAHNVLARVDLALYATRTAPCGLRRVRACGLPPCTTTPAPRKEHT